MSCSSSSNSATGGSNSISISHHNEASDSQCTSYVEGPTTVKQSTNINDSMSVLSPSCRETLHKIPLGSQIRSCCFNLDSTYTFLNNGSYGTAPTPVLNAQATFVNRMEQNPDRFMRSERHTYLRKTRESLASFVNASSADDIVMVTNATTGVNAVLRSMDLQDDDEVLCLNLAYPAILNTLRHICYYTQELVTLKVVDVTLPIKSYEDLINLVLDAITPNTRLAVFDHITSGTALVLPLQQLVAECRRRNVPVLVDGAHAPGQILDLNLSIIDADFYVGNCYKWSFASKSCAFLHVRESQQANVRPVVTSLGYDQGFVADFSVQGTRDESNFFTLPTAIDFLNAVGRTRIYEHNKSLVSWASKYLAETWGTEELLPEWQRAPFMSAIRLPLTCEDSSVCDRVAELLETECRVMVKVVPIAGKMYVRISAQVYNEKQDYVTLSNSVLALCQNNYSLVSKFKKINL